MRLKERIAALKRAHEAEAMADAGAHAVSDAQPDVQPQPAVQAEVPAVQVPAAQVEDKPENRRWAQRRPSVMAARFVHPSMTESVPCVIRDMSATGAKVAVEPSRFGPLQSTSDLPDELVLVIRNDNTEVDCRIVWRTALAVGVHFLSAIRPTAYRPPAIKTSKGKIKRR